MKRIKLFLITYQEGPSRETREWPGQSADHALKRFRRARELSNRETVKLVSVREVRAAA
jgi:hypothetical protein